MPVNIWERNQSRSFTIDSSTASLTRTFFVQGTQDETEVNELVLAYTTVIFDNLVRKTVKAEHQGGGCWFIDVEYATIDAQQAVDTAPPTEPTAPGADDPIGPAFSFDTTGQTIHIGQSRGTRSKTDAAGTTLGNGGNNFTLDNNRAIGLTKDKVTGCDIHAPTFGFQLDVQRANCTGTYLMALFANTGKVNYAAPFWVFPAGTLLYLGASGRYTQRDRWSITHKFAASPNEQNVRVSSDIVVPMKYGWDYLWVGYGRGEVGPRLLDVPKAAYVEIVYPTGDFTALGIGG